LRTASSGIWSLSSIEPVRPLESRRLPPVRFGGEEEDEVGALRVRDELEIFPFFELCEGEVVDGIGAGLLRKQAVLASRMRGDCASCFWV